MSGRVEAALGTLQAAPVPERLRAPGDAVVAALKAQSAGFKDRTAGLSSGDDQLWRRGNDELARAENDLRAALAQFPADANPANY